MSQFSKEGQEKTNSTREETGFFLCHLFFLLRIQAKLPGNSALESPKLFSTFSIIYHVQCV